jgi:hypothetical protein
MENKQSEAHHEPPQQPQPSSDDKPNAGLLAISNTNCDVDDPPCYAVGKMLLRR